MPIVPKPVYLQMNRKSLDKRDHTSNSIYFLFYRRKEDSLLNYLRSPFLRLNEKENSICCDTK